VVQAEDVETGLAQRIVALITSNLGRTGESRVVVGRDSVSGRAMGCAEFFDCRHNTQESSACTRSMQNLLRRAHDAHSLGA
jgi:hypothetical protein